MNLQSWNQRSAELMADYEKTLGEYGVPAWLWGGLTRWIVWGVRPGSFLQAVIRCDLVEVAATADPVSRMHVCSIVNWLHTHAPADCWQTEENADAWKAKQGEMGNRCTEIAR